VVSPAYRLLPEASGGDVLDDVKDFWVWVRSTLASEITAQWSHVQLEVDRVAAFGESAGGYLSLQSAFLCPEANIKLVMPQYCAMFPDLSEYYSKKLPTAPDAADIADAYIKNINPGAIRLYAPYWSFLPTTLAILGSGRKVGFMNDDVRLTLEYSLSHAKSLPPIWVAQGEDDVIVSGDGAHDVSV
jgi:acetyl esterase/lipase